MSERSTRVLIIVLVVLGLLMSAYLTWVHLLGLSLVCLAGNGDCETVQSSRYAEILGVPVAALGVGGYAVLLLSAVLRGEGGALLGLFVTLISVIFSAYLTYLELFVIYAICQWCVKRRSYDSSFCALRHQGRPPEEQPLRVGAG